MQADKQLFILKGYTFMKTTKLLSIMLAVVLLLSAVPFASGFALASDDGIETLEIAVSDDVTITANIPSEYAADFTEEDLVDIAINDDLQDGDVITILDMGEPEENYSAITYIGESYVTTITSTGNEYASNTYFVTSVAKGQTITLTTGYTQALNVGFGSTTPYVTAQIGASLTASYTVTYQFAGPPETSSYNSREYRVRFYARQKNWTQDKYNIWGDYVESRSGVAYVPTRWASYCIDSNI
jgi:hypothetical protein